MRLMEVFLIFLQLFAISSCSIIIGTGLECQARDRSFCRIEKCEMKAVRRGVKEVSITAKMFQLPIYGNVTIVVDILRRGSKTQSLYKATFDGCRFFKSKRRNPIATAIYNFLGLGTYSNINHSCPYNHDLIVDRLVIDKNWNLGLPIGNGEYAVKTFWIVSKILRVSVISFIQVTD